jgi:hypothetical protein
LAGQLDEVGGQSFLVVQPRGNAALRGTMLPELGTPAARIASARIERGRCRLGGTQVLLDFAQALDAGVVARDVSLVDSDAGIALELLAMARIRNDPPTTFLRTLNAQGEWIGPQFHL